MLRVLLQRTVLTTLTKTISFLLVLFANTLHANNDLAKQAQNTHNGNPHLNSASQPNIDRPVSELQLQQYRQSYQMAREAYSQKDPYFHKLKPRLKKYPLYPYLEYDELIDRISELPYSDVDKFLEKHQGSYLGDRLLSRWLKELASIEHWHEYQSYYRTELHSTELLCLSLQARYKTAKEFSPEKIQSLWLTGRSQPNACDPLFKEWQQKGYLTQELLWQRHQMAIKRRNKKLAGFLQGKMNEETQRLAKLYQQIYTNPEQVEVIKKSSEHSNKVADIVYDGLYRYAYYEPLKTSKLLKRYQKSHSFEKESIDQLRSRIAFNLVRKNHIKPAKKIIESLPDDLKIKPIERLLRLFLQEQNWHKLYNWVDQLPVDTANTDRWQYWKARALENINENSEISNHQVIYHTLAKKRSFYGFLSADKIQQQYDFEHQPAQTTALIFMDIEKAPALQRAREQFILGNMHLARQEWRYGIKGFNREQLIASAQLANRWGWHRKAIEAMAGAKNWNDLSIRFPIVYENIVNQAAKSFSVSPSLVFAIARQESAWEFDARSRVGATGLMQLMPATAKETAKKAGISHHKDQLIDPQHNITLGSHYISGLLNKFNNNRLLAIAAYNAGPHRVTKWLQKSGRTLPYDVWVEIIPFKETRHYVQNVLTYGVVYTHRRGEQSKLITLHEARDLL